MHNLLENRYELLKVIGIGGMATVYVARDIRTGSIVAVKLMDKKLLSEPSYIKRFKREISIIKNLDNPHIPHLIDYGTTEDSDGIELPFLVMEYVQGVTLSKYIKQKGKLSLKEAINITNQILSALSYAYKNGVKAHRDIKPSNVMIDPQTGRVKVMDFGIAKTVTSNLTNSTALFTPHYASPEQLMPSKYNNNIDKRSDIYSLGILMYQMLTGKVPYSVTTPVEIAEQQLNINSDLFKKVKQSIPSPYSDIILKCIHPNPNSRYQSPEELMTDLKLGRCTNPIRYPSPSQSDMPTQIGKRNRYNTSPPSNNNPPNFPYYRNTPTGYSSSPSQSNQSKKYLPYIIVPVIIAIIGLFAIIGINASRNNKTSNNASGTPASLLSSFLSIKSDPQGAEIYIDGKDMGKTPFSKQTIPLGHHTILLKKTGYEDLKDTIEVEKGKDEIFSYKLLPKQSSLSQNKEGYLSISSDPPNADIYINGKKINNNTPVKIALLSGKYDVKITKQGYKDYTKQITLQSDKTETLFAKLEKIQSPQPKPTVSDKGELYVSSTPKGAKVYINGNYIGVTPVSKKLEPGSYKVQIVKSGYMNYQTYKSISKNGITKVSVTLIPKKTYLSVFTTPEGAKIYIDGKYVGISPIKSFTLPGGTHTIVAAKTGYLKYTTEFALSTGENKELKITLIKLP